MPRTSTPPPMAGPTQRQSIGSSLTTSTGLDGGGGDG